MIESRNKHKDFINKEIYLLRLAVTTNCNLRCKYCFVRKTNEEMSFLTAKNAIKIFLKSPGRRKLLIIYGGEPLLNFNLLEKVVLYAEMLITDLNKELVVSLGTNGLLLNKDYLIFFKEHNIKLAISMDGNSKAHNNHRVYKNGKGSFEKISSKFCLINKYISSDNLCALFAVHPKNACNMFSNFILLNRFGFKSINIEPIQNLSWMPKEVAIFSENMNRIGAYIVKNIERNNFIFLNSTNRELNDYTISMPRQCPLYQRLEIYPSGDMAFSPFLINSLHKYKYLVGNINKGFNKKYIRCKFNLDRCSECGKDYFGNELLISNCDAIDIRNNLSVKLAKIISELSRNDKVFAKYIIEAKKRIFE